jgi:hypothetical protein
MGVSSSLPGSQRSSWSSATGRRYAVTTGIFVVLIAVGASAYWFLSSGPGNRIVSPPGSQVTEFNGSGDEMTSSFAVRGQWQIHWENTGESFSFAVQGDGDLGRIIEYDGPGSGVTSVVADGQYHLAITAKGDWKVRITQGE